MEHIDIWPNSNGLADLYNFCVGMLNELVTYR